MDQLNRIKIERFKVRNYRSIRRSEVAFSENLTFLIGRNGSGKSSFFDALGFLKALLAKGLASALEERNGLSSILRRPVEFPSTMEFELCFSDLGGSKGEIAVTLQAESWTELRLASERCKSHTEEGKVHGYRVENGLVTGTDTDKDKALPPVIPDRLYLGSVAGFPQYRTAYELLSTFHCSEYSPKSLHLLLFNRFPQSYQLSLQVKDLLANHPTRRRVIEDYLRLMIPNFDRLEIESSGGRDWVAFVERTRGSEEKFYLSQVSDGTVYATELLMDLFLRGVAKERSIPVLVEEPGGSLHPWAAGILRNALQEASVRRQVIVTTHSPDLIDDSSIDPEMLRTVYRDTEGTHIETLGHGAMTVLGKGLITPGELFRQGGLSSDNEPEISPVAV